MFELFGKTIGYLRGLFLKLRISSSGMVCSRGSTKIMKTNGSIEIGDRTCLWPKVKLVAIGNDSAHPARLRIGKYCSLGDRTQIHCGKNVTIGDRVLISWDVNIIENEYHGLGGSDPNPKGISIGDEVWIGCNVIILNGVTIGKGATIGAGSVVARDIEPYTLAAGNPAKPIRKSDSWYGPAPDESNSTHS